MNGELSSTPLQIQNQQCTIKIKNKQIEFSLFQAWESKWDENQAPYSFCGTY